MGYSTGLQINNYTCPGLDRKVIRAIGRVVCTEEIKYGAGKRRDGGGWDVMMREATQ